MMSPRNYDNKYIYLCLRARVQNQARCEHKKETENSIQISFIIRPPIKLTIYSNLTSIVFSGNNRIVFYFKTDWIIAIFVYTNNEICATFLCLCNLSGLCLHTFMLVCVCLCCHLLRCSIFWPEKQRLIQLLLSHVILTRSYLERNLSHSSPFLGYYRSHFSLCSNYLCTVVLLPLTFLHNKNP